MQPSERLQRDQHSQINWQYMLTVRTPTSTDRDEAYNLINQQIMRTLRNHCGSLVCGYGVLNHLSSSHCHVVIRAHEPDRMADLTTKTLVEILKTNKCSLGFITDAVVIKPIYDNGGAIQYIHDNYPERSDKGDWLWFGQRLLDALYRAYPLPTAN